MEARIQAVVETDRRNFAFLPKDWGDLRGPYLYKVCLLEQHSQIPYTIILIEVLEMITKGNVEIGLMTNVGPNWPSIRCGARTRRGTACQKPPLAGKKRCRLHGGLSTGPRTAEGKSRIAASQWKHGRRSRAFTEARKQIWADLRAVEARMRADGII